MLDNAIIIVWSYSWPNIEMYSGISIESAPRVLANFKLEFSIPLAETSLRKCF